MSVKIIYGYNKIKEIKNLFTEYTNILISLDDEVTYCLKKQGYKQELVDISKKYGLPYGRLYVAYLDDKLAGCIALRKMDENFCEMKRLYVKFQFRGQKIGSKLIEKILDDAKRIGYKKMFLDTAYYLKPAVHLYKKYGFEEIEPYYDNPMKSAIYMSIDL